MRNIALELSNHSIKALDQINFKRRLTLEDMEYFINDYKLGVEESLKNLIDEPQIWKEAVYDGSFQQEIKNAPGKLFEIYQQQVLKDIDFDTRSKIGNLFFVFIGFSGLGILGALFFEQFIWKILAFVFATFSGVAGYFVQLSNFKKQKDSKSEELELNIQGCHLEMKLYLDSITIKLSEEIQGLKNVG